MRKPELLAPAGDRASFEAAIGAGADAVYLGLESFNARRNAGNFDLEDLSCACREAHMRQRRVYLTANTLVFPEEMGEALEMVSDACDAGIDAAIVQDVGLISVLRRDLPDLEIHASTQLNIRDKKGIELAFAMGCSRVTLARELSLEKIAELSKLGMDLEVFAHGALCICQSGQCLLSSLVGSRSANRGLCAQPCRLPYKLVDGEGNVLSDDGPYLLSPRDLCSIESLVQLMQADVSSLKIEGRMKSAEYVSTVTSIYRDAIDAAWTDAGSFAVDPGAVDALKEAFNRGFTEGYLKSDPKRDLMGCKRPNNRGVPVGRVVGFSAGNVKLESSCAIEPGDLLEFWTSKGRVTYTVAQSDSLKGPVKFLSVKDPVSKGDRVFRVRSARLQRRADETTDAGMKIPVSIDVEMLLGRPLKMRVRHACGKSACLEGPVVEAARTKAVTEDDVVSHVGRLGATPFVCDDWNITLDEGVGIGFSTLHKMRQSVLGAIEEELDVRGERAGVSSRVDIDRIVDSSSMAPFATVIRFDDANIACELGRFEAGRAIGPKMYATNVEAVKTWAALGASFIWLSPELTLHQMKLLADESPIPLGVVVIGRQELMVSDHCFLTSMGPCDGRCNACERRSGKLLYLEDRKGYRFPVTTDVQGKGHLYNAVELDVAHAIGDLLRAGIKGFAVDATLMDDKEAQRALERVRSGLNGKNVPKKPDSTSGHLFRPVL